MKASEYEFLMSILTKIDTLREGMISYAYLSGNAPMTYTWWEIACSDINMYLNDSRFKALTKAWHKAGKARGMKIIFVACTPSEEKLSKLLENDNLLMNVN